MASWGSVPRLVGRSGHSERRSRQPRTTAGRLPARSAGRFVDRPPEGYGERAAAAAEPEDVRSPEGNFSEIKRPEKQNVHRAFPQVDGAQSPARGSVARGGVEPPTFRFSVGRSYQLSYLAAHGALRS